MKRKTFERLIKRFSILPMHHIDTSIVLEPEKTEDGFYCKKYLNIVGYKYRGVLSFPTLGELLFRILKLETPQERYELLDLLLSFIKEKRIVYRSVQNTEDVVKRIEEIDPTITPLDRLILSCAISHKAKVLVTLDSRLIRNRLIEREFQIEIKHPKELL